MGKYIIAYIILIILYVLYWLCNYYKPKIEIVIVNRHFKVYLWYTLWYGPIENKRFRKYLFKI